MKRFEVRGANEEARGGAGPRSSLLTRTSNLAPLFLRVRLSLRLLTERRAALFISIDAVFLYPSLGLFSGAIHDPQLAAAVCRAYNRWLADYCKPYPERLFGVAMLPLGCRAGGRRDAFCQKGAWLPRRVFAAQPL